MRPPRSSVVGVPTGCVGGVEPHAVPVPPGLTRGVVAPRGEPRLLVLGEMGRDVRMTVDRGIRRRARTEDLVAEGVVEVRVGVHDPPNGAIEALAHVDAQRLALAGLGPRVDEQHAVVALDDDDRDVERVVSAQVDARGDRMPCSHVTKRSDQPAAKPRP